MRQRERKREERKYLRTQAQEFRRVMNFAKRRAKRKRKREERRGGEREKDGKKE